MNQILRYFRDLFRPAPDDDVIYEPIHVGMVLLVSFATLGVLFWLVWAILVCEGGLFAKIGPFLQVVFTSKVLADFGFRGHPYALGVFEGWIVNLTALILLLVLIAALHRLYHAKQTPNKEHSI